MKDEPPEINPTLINEESIIRLYDEYLGDYALSFSNVGMMNWGYWKEDTPDVSASQINLIRKMLEGSKLKDKKVLDIGCGVGGTAIYIHNNFSTKTVDGINISPMQVKMAEKLAKEMNCAGNVSFQVANASSIPFPDHVYDLVMVIESAFHFLRKDHFIGEAYRVLKPGGKFIMADITLTEDSGVTDFFANELSEFNQRLQVPHLARISDWSKLLTDKLFSNIKLYDITKHSAIDPARLIRNSFNGKISLNQQEQQRLGENLNCNIKQWDQSWYLLLGKLAFNKVIRYYIISADKDNSMQL